MKLFAYSVLLLLLAALFVYFFGTKWVADITGISPRTISLIAGFAVVLLGIVGVMIGRLSAARPHGK